METIGNTHMTTTYENTIWKQHMTHTHVNKHRDTTYAHAYENNIGKQYQDKHIWTHISQHAYIKTPMKIHMKNTYEHTHERKKHSNIS